MGKISDMGIRRKVTTGCILLSLVLFVSSIIAVFEFRKMDDFVKKVIDDDIADIEMVRSLYDETEAFNDRIMLAVDNDDAQIGSFIRSVDMEGRYASLRRTFTDGRANTAVDSITYAFAAYMQVMAEAPSVWLQGSFERREWLYHRLQPVYVELRRYVMALTSVTEDSLIASSQSLQGSFHRSIMPSIVAMLIGLAMVALFHFYLNNYLIKPVLSINRGIKSFRQYGKTYDVKVDGFDELHEINEEITNLTEINRNCLRKLKQQS